MPYKVDLCMPCWNNAKYTRIALESLILRTNPERTDFHLILVDNASGDETPALLKEIQARLPGRVTIITNQENKGWVTAVNQGVEAMRPGADYFLMVNNDVMFTKDDWLFNLIDPIAERPELAGSGPVSNAVGGRQNTMHNNRKVTAEEVPYLIGFCFLVKRSAINLLMKLDGYFMDERFSPGGADEIDICIRLADNGYRFYVNREVYVHHFLSKSLSKITDDLNTFHEDKVKILQKKHGVKRVESIFGRVMKRTLIAVPTLGQVHWKFVMTLQTLVKPEGVILEMLPRSLPDIARNNLAETALSCGADFIFYLDDDMLFNNENLLMKFLETMDKRPEIDMISAVPFMRNYPHYPCVFTAHDDVPYYRVYTNFNKGVQEVDATTSACTLIRTDLFRRMEEGMGHKRYYDFLHIGKERMGEDVAFCYQAKKYANARIFVDTDEFIGHIADPIVITRKTYEMVHQQPIVREVMKF